MFMSGYYELIFCNISTVKDSNPAYLQLPEKKNENINKYWKKHWRWAALHPTT